MTTGSDAASVVRRLTGARVVDVRTGRVSERSTIEIRDGRIHSVGPDQPPEGAAGDVDLEGRYVLPAPITCHVHLQGTYPYSTRDPSEAPQRTALRAARRATDLLGHGFGTVRSVHELNRADLHVRHAATMGWLAAPRIFGAGRALSSPGGHGDGLGAVVARGRAGFAEAAEEELTAGADHVKLFASGGLARAGETFEEPELSLEEMRGAVEAAAVHGAYVVAHAAGSATIWMGLDAGIRSFEHAYLLDGPTARAIADAGAFLTPTLVVTHAVDWMLASGFDASSVERSGAFADRHLASIRHAVEAGVALVHGTDFPPDGSSDGTTLAVREVELLVEAGASALTALQSCTLTAARLLGREGALGEIRPECAADLVAMPDDPTASVRALRTVDVAIVGGELIRATPRGTGGARWTHA